MFDFVLVTILKMDVVWHLYFFHTSQLYVHFTAKCEIEKSSSKSAEVISLLIFMANETDRRLSCVNHNLAKDIYQTFVKNQFNFLIFILFCWSLSCMPSHRSKEPNILQWNFDHKLRWWPIQMKSITRYYTLSHSRSALRKENIIYMYMRHSTFEWWFFQIKAIAWAFCVAADCDQNILLFFERFFFTIFTLFAFQSDRQNSIVLENFLPALDSAPDAIFYDVIH